MQHQQLHFVRNMNNRIPMAAPGAINSNSIPAQMNAFKFPDTKEPQFPRGGFNSLQPWPKNTGKHPTPLSGVAMERLHRLDAQKYLEGRGEATIRRNAPHLAKVKGGKRPLGLMKRQENQDEWLKRSQQRGFQIQKDLSEAEANLAYHLDNLAQIEAANVGKLHISGGPVFRLGLEVAAFIAEYRIANPVSPMKARMKVIEAQNEVTIQEELLEAYKKGLFREMESKESRSSRLRHFGLGSRGEVEGKVNSPLQQDSPRVRGIEGYEADNEDEGDGESSFFWPWDEDDEDDSKMGDSTPEPPDGSPKGKSQFDLRGQRDPQSAVPPSRAGHSYVPNPNSPRDDITPPQEMMDSDTDNNIIRNRPPPPPAWQPLSRTPAEIDFYYRTLREYDAKHERSRGTHALYDTKNNSGSNVKSSVGLGLGRRGNCYTQQNSPLPPAVAHEDSTPPENDTEPNSGRESESEPKHELSGHSQHLIRLVKKALQVATEALALIERNTEPKPTAFPDRATQVATHINIPPLRTDTRPPAQKELSKKRGRGNNWNAEARQAGHAMCTRSKRVKLE